MSMPISNAETPLLQGAYDGNSYGTSGVDVESPTLEHINALSTEVSQGLRSQVATETIIWVEREGDGSTAAPTQGSGTATDPSASHAGREELINLLARWVIQNEPDNASRMSRLVSRSTRLKSLEEHAQRVTNALASPSDFFAGTDRSRKEDEMFASMREEYEENVSRKLITKEEARADLAELEHRSSFVALPNYFSRQYHAEPLENAATDCETVTKLTSTAEGGEVKAFSRAEKPVTMYGAMRNARRSLIMSRMMEQFDKRDMEAVARSGAAQSDVPVESSAE